MRLGTLAIRAALMAVAPLAHADVDDDLPSHPVHRHHTAGPWIMFGVGATLFVAATLTEIFANLPGGGSVMCAPNCPPPPEVVTIRVAAGIGMGVSAGLAIAGLIWHFAEPTSRDRVALVPIVAPQTGGLAFRMSF